MNPQAHRSTEELKTIVKALSKLSLNFTTTPEEEQRLFECEQELRKRKREVVDGVYQTHTFK